MEATLKARRRKENSRARHNEVATEVELQMEEVRERQNALGSAEDQDTVLLIPSFSKEQLHKAFTAFDKANTQLVYSHCQVCHQIRLDWKVVCITFGQQRLMCCNKCKNLTKADMKSPQQWLPTWKDNNNKIHYEIPRELAMLREGEKLLIQKLNVYVPVYHIYKGQTASKGHCAAFKQDINTIADRLPRLPKEVEFVQVIKKYRDSNGDAGEK